jgi:hypothetical protein
MSVRKVCLLFNAQTKVRIGEIDLNEYDHIPSFNPEAILTKIVELKDTEYWEGNFDTGKVYDATNIPTVTQEELQIGTHREILSEYPLYDQVNIISDQLALILTEENKIEEFVNMRTFIEEVREKYRAKKEYYINHPDTYHWVSNEEVLEDAKKAFTNLTDVFFSTEEEF